MLRPVLETDDFACFAGQLEDVRTRTSTINDVNITTIVDIHVVGLDLRAQ